MELSGLSFPLKIGFKLVNNVLLMGHSQFSQCGEQGTVRGVLLEVVFHCLNNYLVVIKVSRPLTNKDGKTL